MKVYFHNFNPASNSGPNKFARQLTNCLVEKYNIDVTQDSNLSDVEIALIQLNHYKKKPLLLRLDGIYFNTRQDFKSQNTPIKYSYENGNCVIFQSVFNKKLTEHWFGVHDNSRVIHNAADKSLIDKVKPIVFDNLEKDIEVWSCASSWRPHKRLSENLRYFCELAPSTAIMVIAGSGADHNIIEKYQKISKERIFYVGELDYLSLVGLYKRSTTFVHLAFIDHCPNVVVDAQAAGCKIVCASSGGTKEIVNNGLVIKDYQWDFSPLDLYDPPKLSFDEYEVQNLDSSKNLNIDSVAKMYYDSLLGIKNEKI